VSAPSGSSRDLAVQTLMSSIIENAQLAALEITDTTDISEAPALLESVQKSVSRSAAVLEQLAHASTDTLRERDAR
jgi:two-component system, chemotaxis family, sensor kinase Cph1